MAVFNGVIAFAISLSIFAAHVYLLKANCRRLHQTEDARGLCFTLPNGSCIASRGFFAVLFCLLVKLARTGYCKDIRIKLFKHILSFRMKYFDLVPWDNWLPVSDIESIARFSAKDFYDYKRLDENGLSYWPLCFT
jgi:hypothetical protein